MLKTKCRGEGLIQWKSLLPNLVSRGGGERGLTIRSEKLSAFQKIKLAN